MEFPNTSKYPFCAEIALQHQLCGKRIELTIQIHGEKPYSIVASGNTLYIYDFKNDLIEAIPV